MLDINIIGGVHRSVGDFLVGESTQLSAPPRASARRWGLGLTRTDQDERGNCVETVWNERGNSVATVWKHRRAVRKDSSTKTTLHGGMLHRRTRPGRMNR